MKAIKFIWSKYRVLSLANQAITVLIFVSTVIDVIIHHYAYATINILWFIILVLFRLLDWHQKELIKSLKAHNRTFNEYQNYVVRTGEILKAHANGECEYKDVN